MKKSTHVKKKVSKIIGISESEGYNLSEIFNSIFHSIAIRDIFVSYLIKPDLRAA